MMLKSKRTIVGMAVAAVLFAGYMIYAMSGNAPAGDDLEGWAFLILKFIAVCIVAEIMVYAAIHLAFSASVTAKEKNGNKGMIKRIILNEMSEDEMDKRITMKSSHSGYGVAGAGFILTLFAIAFFGISAALALNLLLAMFFLSMMVSSCVSVCLYEIGENRFDGWDCE